MKRIWKKAAMMALLLAVALTSLAFAGEIQGRLNGPKFQRPIKGRTTAKWTDLSGQIHAGLMGAGALVRDGSTLTVDDPVCVNFVVRNEGNTTTTFRFQRKILSGGTIALDGGIEWVTLRPGEFKSLPHTFVPLYGATRAILWVDQVPGLPGQHQETNENNNIAFVTFYKQ